MNAMQIRSHAETVAAGDRCDTPAAMRLKSPGVSEVLTRRQVYEALLPLAHAQVLELGCGAADATREIAGHFPGVTITALEVDGVQHEKNRAIADLPNVRFELGGAEAIPAQDASFDIVLMFRSLHHVPVADMDRALREIHRVLKRGGLAYFEEPVFDGEYSEVVRVFHDEQRVREAAFLALQRAVASGLMELVTEKFFLLHKRFRDWAQFERKVREETHTQHRPTAAQWEAARERFMRSMSETGVLFAAPMRADLLRKPLA
jgi:ubiquinone/menaquinone biosynthesis C-methylase UbiE